MSKQTLQMTPQLYDYMIKNSVRELHILKELRIRTETVTGSQMIISPEQGQLMNLLLELLNAKKTLDIGTFTGYSALIAALALPKGGKVITCDINPETTNIAKEFWEKAGVSDRIELRLAPADKTLDELIESGASNSFDFAFIDADKASYKNYYEKCLKLVRIGGLIAIDNVLWGGRVADLNQHDRATDAIRAFNEELLHDKRVSISLVPIGDGLTLARKRV